MSIMLINYLQMNSPSFCLECLPFIVPISYSLCYKVDHTISYIILN